MNAGLESMRDFVKSCAVGLLDTALGLLALVGLTLATVWVLNLIAAWRGL